jgi:hypothetical protein
MHDAADKRDRSVRPQALAGIRAMLLPEAGIDSGEWRR